MRFLGESESLHSCLPVSFIFLTLLLFPVNLWMYELKQNISVPIGWTYFVGWLALILYLTCGEWLGRVLGKEGTWVGQTEDVWKEGQATSLLLHAHHKGP